MSKGSGCGARREMHNVSGRLRFWPRVLNEVCVSPRPWRRRRMFVAGWEDGAGFVRFWVWVWKGLRGGLRGVMVRVMEEGKSEGVGRRPGILGAGVLDWICGFWWGGWGTELDGFRDRVEIYAKTDVMEFCRRFEEHLKSYE